MEGKTALTECIAVSSGPGEYNIEKADRVVGAHSPQHKIGVRLGERQPDSLDYPGQYILQGFSGAGHSLTLLPCL